MSKTKRAPRETRGRRAVSVSAASGAASRNTSMVDHANWVCSGRGVQYTLRLDSGFVFGPRGNLYLAPSIVV